MYRRWKHSCTCRRSCCDSSSTKKKTPVPRIISIETTSPHRDRYLSSFGLTHLKNKERTVRSRLKRQTEQQEGRMKEGKKEGSWSALQSGPSCLENSVLRLASLGFISLFSLALCRWPLLSTPRTLYVCLLSPSLSLSYPLSSCLFDRRWLVYLSFLLLYIYIYVGCRVQITDAYHIISC